jgi:hypothetical protein
VFALVSGLQLLLAHAYADFSNAHDSVHGNDQQYSDALLSVLENVHMIRLVTFIQYKVLQAADEAIADIPAHEANTPIYYKPFQYDRLTSSVNDDECRNITHFIVRDEIRELIGLFDLLIIICTTRYTFHAEEILIYILLFMASASNHFMTCVKVGSREIQMGEGYKWITKCLDDRYYNLLGPCGLELWGDEFPLFAKKIQEMIVKDRLWYDKNTQVMTAEPGVYFQEGQCNISGFTDRKYYRSTRVGSGPDNTPCKHVGSGRRLNWFITQLAFYTGHKKLHGVQLLTFLIPSGLTAAVFGSCYIHHHDTKLLDLSWIDDILY